MISNKEDDFPVPVISIISMNKIKIVMDSCSYLIRLIEANNNVYLSDYYVDLLENDNDSSDSDVA